MIQPVLNMTILIGLKIVMTEMIDFGPEIR